MSSNGAVCGKFTVIHVKYMHGIEISTNMADHGTKIERHTNTWHNWPGLAINGYMLHLQFRQKQKHCLKHFILWLRWRTPSVPEQWSPRLQLHCYYGDYPYWSFYNKNYFAKSLLFAEVTIRFCKTFETEIDYAANVHIFDCISIKFNQCRGGALLVWHY